MLLLATPPTARSGAISRGLRDPTGPRDGAPHLPYTPHPLSLSTTVSTTQHVAAESHPAKKSADFRDSKLQNLVAFGVPRTPPTECAFRSRKLKFWEHVTSRDLVGASPWNSPCNWSDQIEADGAIPGFSTEYLVGTSHCKMHNLLLSRMLLIEFSLDSKTQLIMTS